jgi:hypothetical protein
MTVTVNVSNLSIFGQVSDRENSSSDYTAFQGGFSSSTINDVWVQNEKSGVYDIGPANGLTVENSRPVASHGRPGASVGGVVSRT